MAAALLGMLLCGCSREGGPDDTAESVTLVTVTEARARNVPVVLNSIGRLESRASPAVAAEIDGRVLSLSVDEGEQVEAGALLATLDATSITLELKAAKAETGRIAALLANEERRRERLRDLHQKGFIAREQLDDAEAQVAVLRAQQEATAARLRIVEDQHSKTVIRSPLAGRIVNRTGPGLGIALTLALAIVGLALSLPFNLLSVLVGLALVAIGTFLAQAMATGHVGRMAGADRAVASGIYLSSYYLGGAVGSYVTGRVFDGFGWEARVVLLIGVLAAGAGFGVGLGRGPRA